jgi:PAT family beta-lactamase induction signal transducer AmpG
MLSAPFGSGAAIGLLPGLAPDFGMSVDQVAWMNGLGGGLLTALGALLVGFLKMPEDLRPVYAWLGLVNALTLGILMLGHPRPVTYLASVTLYMITIGACYGVFTALVLKLLGVSGKSGGSRYAIAVSLGNLPIFYMTVVDGLGARWFGTKGEPGIDLAVSGTAAVFGLLWFSWERRRALKRSSAQRQVGA